MGSFTNAIRSLLGRKRDKKEILVDSPPPNPPAIYDAPPRLPAIESSSPLTTEKPLPPSHPLASRQLQEPRETVPTNTASENSPSVPTETSDTLRASEQGERRDVSPGGLSPGGSRRSIAISGISDRDRAGSSPVVNGDGAVAAVPEAAAAAATPSETTTTTATAIHTRATAEENIDPAVPAAKENEPSTVHSEVTEPSSHINGHTMIPESVLDQGKIAVLQEPPPALGNIRTAPGMSATSGPLEDFPEGGGF